MAVETLAGERSATQAGAAPPPVQSESPGLYEHQQHQKAAWLWSQGQPIAGTIAEKYPRSRGITCPLPATLRYLPPSRREHHPAMMAAFGIADEPEPGLLAEPRKVAAVHLTLLTPDGAGKADVKPNKIIVGSPGGMPIVLAPPNDLLAMCITEGIEDALALHQALGVGAWAGGPPVSCRSWLHASLAGSRLSSSKCIPTMAVDMPNVSRTF